MSCGIMYGARAATTPWRSTVPSSRRSGGRFALADGRGPCWEQAAGIPDVKRNMRGPFVAAGKVGRRSGACVVSGSATGYPCDTDADCPSGTCDVSADRFTWSAGAYLCVTSISGSAISCSANTEAE